MTPSLRVLLALTAASAAVHTFACSSRFRNDNENAASAGGTSSSGTTGSSGMAGEGPDVTGNLAASTNGGSADGSGGTSGGTATGASTGVSGSAGTGGTAGSGGNAGSGSTAGSGGNAGTGGAPVVQICEPDESDCACDATGCFLVPGAECTRSTDCTTQICGVTQDADNICCAEACGDDQVCSDDGTSCETAVACEEDLERCSAQGDHQRCADGQWNTVAACEGRGCSLELTGGCLSALGATCVDDEECGQGTCQETPGGERVCCDASCGSCQVCNQEGTGCTEPASVKAGCDCTEADSSNCDDGRPCTIDACQEGVCSNEVESGYCLIDGQCYDHNQPEPGNVCRYCDAALRERAWTNSANGLDCDDGAWCNGEDACNGTGQCLHEFPTSNRCAESGPCALTTCDEERDSCYQPDTFVCTTETEDRCKPNDSIQKCGGEIQRRTTSSYCSGTSAACDGATVTGKFLTLEECYGSCDAEAVACAPTLSCVSLCDSDTDLCWTRSASETGPTTFDAATAFCEDLVLAGRNDWRLPTLEEWLQLAKGCDEATGEAKSVTFQSTCTFDSGEDPEPCSSSCPDGAGPTNGCYWPTAMGTCNTSGYWSSTDTSPPITTDRYGFIVASNWVALSGISAELAVRCVTERSE